MSEGTPVKVEKSLKIGQKVDVCKDGNKFRGTVAYVGTTLFSPGKWIGVILEEKEGKNNGTVMAKTYFSVMMSQLSSINISVFILPINLFSARMAMECLCAKVTAYLWMTSQMTPIPELPAPRLLTRKINQQKAGVITNTIY